MQKVGGQGKHKKDQVELIEWEFHEDEAAWQGALGTPALASASPQHWGYRRWLASAILLLLLLVSARGLWVQAQSRLYVAVPERGGSSAAILVYEAERETR